MVDLGADERSRQGFGNEILNNKSFTFNKDVKSRALAYTSTMFLTTLRFYSQKVSELTLTILIV
jgi:hypothetical protein